MAHMNGVAPTRTECSAAADADAIASQLLILYYSCLLFPYQLPEPIYSMSARLFCFLCCLPSHN